MAASTKTLANPKAKRGLLLLAALVAFGVVIYLRRSSKAAAAPAIDTTALGGLDPLAGIGDTFGTGAGGNGGTTTTIPPRTDWKDPKQPGHHPEEHASHHPPGWVAPEGEASHEHGPRIIPDSVPEDPPPVTTAARTPRAQPNRPQNPSPILRRSGVTTAAPLPLQRA